MSEILEEKKSKEQKAEDIAYTLNHSIYCTLTDFLNPPVNAATDGYLRWLIPGCGHDHSADGHEGCSHGHFHPSPELSRMERTKQAFKASFSKERLIQYTKGEFIGDFASVPITIFIQRNFPNLMNGLRKICEPIVGGLFKWGVEKDAKKWANAEHISLDSAEYKNRVEKDYEYEMNHVPQAAVWTASSLGLNTAYQMWADKSNLPFEKKLLLKSSSVLSGVLVTAGVVVAARVFAPHAMHNFDKKVSENAILPATKAIGSLFGITEEDVDRMQENHQKMKNEKWQDRVISNEKSNYLSALATLTQR